jgi:protoporphyrin/coproporphyrin ferrochelatase
MAAMNEHARAAIAAAKQIGPLPDGHPMVVNGKVGVLIVNLGTPDGTDYFSMRRYLAQFLSDRRVIESPRWLWYPLLHGVILTTRPSRSGKAYASIWNKEKNESPLRTFTRAQGEALAAIMSGHKEIVVDWAMRYGNPSIDSVVKRMREKGCDRILVFPLYPHYSASTTATVNDEVFRSLMKMRFQPSVRTVPSYHDDLVYIDALAVSIEKHLAALPFKPEVIIASYHGVPKTYLMKGDPYHCQCLKTTRLLRDRLGMSKDMLITTFQSRFGPQEWLQPYTDKTLEKLGKDGVKSLAILNPGFVSDCLETLEEIAVEGAETFHHAGGKNYSHIPCLNASPEGMKVIEYMVRQELAGWID